MLQNLSIEVTGKFSNVYDFSQKLSAAVFIDLILNVARSLLIETAASLFFKLHVFYILNFKCETKISLPVIQYSL